MSKNTITTTAITIRLPIEVMQVLDKVAPPIPQDKHTGIRGGRAKFVRDLILKELGMTIEDPHLARAEKARQRKNETKT